VQKKPRRDYMRGSGETVVKNRKIVDSTYITDGTGSLLAYRELMED
jgi:hypothetical protein